MNCIWIARDNCGRLYAFNIKPERGILSDHWITDDYSHRCRINDDWFPQLTWEDEPIELVIKQDAITALDTVLDNWVHGGDEDYIIAEFEEELNKEKED